MVSPSFLYLGFLLSVFKALLLGLVEVSFCYRLALLDVKLANKKRHLGECLLGKLDAIVMRPYGQRRPYLSEFKHLLTRKMLSKGFSKLGVQSLSGVCSGLPPEER